MKLYLVRHGENETVGSDDERTLSTKGKEDIEHLSNFISQLKLQVSYVFQSPKLRVQQTAKILCSQMTIINEIETKVELEPLAPITDVIDELSVLNGDVMLVGHMPFMGKLVSQLVTGNENKNVVAFKAGSMLCLEKIEDNQWVIRWMLNPELFY